MPINPNIHILKDKSSLKKYCFLSIFLSMFYAVLFEKNKIILGKVTDYRIKIERLVPYLFRKGTSALSFAISNVQRKYMQFNFFSRNLLFLEIANVHRHENMMF